MAGWMGGHQDGWMICDPGPQGNYNTEIPKFVSHRFSPDDVHGCATVLKFLYAQKILGKCSTQEVKQIYLLQENGYHVPLSSQNLAQLLLDTQ